MALIVTFLIPIWWGGDGRFPWDNSIAPAAVLKALAARFRPGFFMTYGPVPYYLTAPPYAVVLVVAKALHELGTPTSVYPWGFRHPEFMMSLLTTVAHVVTLALGLGIVAMAATRDPDGGGPRRRWLVPLLFLGSPIFMYYARTSNVDVHYLFWLWLGLVLVERARGSWRVLAAAAAAAAMAVCSKEQSAPVAIVIVMAAMVSALRARSDGVAPRLLAAAGLGVVAVATYAVMWRLPWNLSGWHAHHEFIFTDAKYDRAFPPTLAGFAGLAARAAGQMLVALGPALAIGVALAIAWRVSWRGLGVRVVAVIAYLVGFLGAIGYTYERFLLPVLLVAMPLGVRGWDVAMTRLGSRRPGKDVLVGALLIAVLAGGPALSVVLLTDPRYEVERWVRTSLPSTASLEIAGNPHYQPRLPADREVVVTKADSLRIAPRGPIGDVVLLSSIDAWSFERDSVSRAVWWGPLHASSGSPAYSRRLEFPRSWAYRFTPGIEVPSMTVLVRDGVDTGSR
jgi:hypothetical protein